jgi:hypothetical protein
MSVCTITATTAETLPPASGSRPASASTTGRRSLACRSIPADRSAPKGVQPSDRTCEARTPVPQPISRQTPRPVPSNSRTARSMPRTSAPAAAVLARNSSSYQSAISSYAAAVTIVIPLCHAIPAHPEYHARELTAALAATGQSWAGTISLAASRCLTRLLSGQAERLPSPA